MSENEVRVCPSCTYEDDDPFTSREPRCAMCNVDIEEAEREAARRREGEQQQRSREEQQLQRAREEEANWRRRRSETEISNAKTFDGSFITQARRKSQIAQDEALRREMEAKRRLEEEAMKRKIEEARRKQEEEAKKKQQEKAKKKQEDVAKRKQVEDAKRKQQEENRKRQREARRIQEEEAKKRWELANAKLESERREFADRSSSSSSSSDISSTLPSLSSASSDDLDFSQHNDQSAFFALQRLFFTMKKESLVVYITGMPGVGVGKSTIKNILQESLGKLKLSPYVTFVVEKDPPSNQSRHDAENRKILVMSIYDICHEESYKYCIDTQCKSVIHPTILVGNKIDMEYWRQVGVQRVASELNETNAFNKNNSCSDGLVVSAFEVSALTGLHVEYLMDVILRLLLAPHFNDEMVQRLFDDGAKADMDPKFRRYSNMLIVGLDMNVVLLKMKADGVRERVLLLQFPRVEYFPQDMLSDYDSTGSDDYSESSELSSASSAISDADNDDDGFNSFLSKSSRNSVDGFLPRRRSFEGTVSKFKEKGKVKNTELPVRGSQQRRGKKIHHEKEAKSDLLEKKLKNRKKKISEKEPLPVPPSAPLPSSPPTKVEDDSDLDALRNSLELMTKISEDISCELMEQNMLLDNMEERVDSPVDLNMALSRQAIDIDIDEEEQCSILENTQHWEDDLPEEVICEEVEDEEPYFDVETGMNQLDMIQDGRFHIDEVKNVMHMNIDKVIDRGDRIDNLVMHSEELQDASLHFKRSTRNLKRKQLLRHCLCCCCLVCVYCKNGCEECASGCADTCATCLNNTSRGLQRFSASLKHIIRSLLPKKSLMDNVLADTENAFQTLAKALSYLVGNERKFRCLGSLYYYLFGVWHKLISWVVSYILILSSTVAIILPSFFTLLIIRTSTIEKESKSFGVRQEVIRHEKKEQSFLRWLRIILRSLPLSCYILVLPYLMVYRLFPSQTHQNVTYILVCYLLGVVVLQVLGSVRVYYSWKTRDTTAVPSAPPLYYVDDIAEEKKTGSLLSGCCRPSTKKQFDVVQDNDIHNDNVSYSQTKKKTPVPVPPNTFSLSSANILVVLSLTLEFLQMASFSLQNNPLDGDSSVNTEYSELSPTAAPTFEKEDSFWGSVLFDNVYINVAVESDFTLTLMWAAVGAVGLLIAIFTHQFFFELKHYGSLLQRIEDKDEAKDSFFFSFTGAIVYGHGKPNNISNRMRLVVSILSDALFLIISMQLLTVFACDSDSDVETKSFLRAKEAVECWEGEHALLATLSLMAYGFYVPLSIMITPMLLEAPSSEQKNKPEDEGVTFLKLYLMTINVVKSVMILVAVLGPQSITSLVLATALSSLILGAITIAWFSNQDITSLPYSSAIHPCNMAFINYWKAASYTTSVVSAVIVISFHYFEESSAMISERSLTDTLLTCWVLIIVVYATFYYQHHKRVKPRRKLVADLISYPFVWRDMKETTSFDSQQISWWEHDSKLESQRHIPGFNISPWHDHRFSAPILASTPTETDVDIQRESLSLRLIQHFVDSKNESKYH